MDAKLAFLCGFRDSSQHTPVNGHPNTTECIGIHYRGVLCSLTPFNDHSHKYLQSRLSHYRDNYLTIADQGPSERLWHWIYVATGGSYVYTYRISNKDACIR